MDCLQNMSLKLGKKIFANLRDYKASDYRENGLLRNVLFSSISFMVNDTHMYHCKYDVLHWMLCDVCECIFC